MHVGCANGLQQLFAVVGELEDRVTVVVDDVDVLLRIVRADVDRMRPAQHLVPLRPVLDDVAVAVDHEDAVRPEEVDAVLAARRSRRRPLPSRLEQRSRGAGLRRVPPQARDREREVRRHLRSRRPAARPCWRDDRERPALNVVDAVRAFREHTLPRAKRPFLVAGRRAQVFRPAGHDLVGAGWIEDANGTGDGSQTAAAR